MLAVIPPKLVTALLRSAPFAVPILIKLFAVLMQTHDVLFSGFSPFKSPLENFDFIVVGGGSAGAAIASRLSEDESVSVLLLEAGGDPNPITYIPAMIDYLIHPSIDWMYRTVGLTGAAQGARNHEMVWPRGKSIGGSSNNNYMMYNRGNKKDFDRWAHMTGDPRWGSENLEKYFFGIEDYHGNWDGEGNHNKGGPLRIEPNRYDPLVPYILRAAQEQGLPTRDANRDLVQRPGFSPVDFTQRRGARFSTYPAYIKHAKHRRNLYIFRYALATKILFADEERPRAIGISYERHGVRAFAFASKEIIVSCGAVNSPKLLMLSGIGPKHHLLEHGIPTIVDLPGVGQNLQDHVTTFVGPFIINKPESYIPERDLNAKAILNYVKYGTGPISLPFAVATVGLGTTTLTTSPNWPDILWVVNSMGIHPTVSTGLNALFNTAHTNLFGRFFRPHIGQDGFFIQQALGLPKSSGYIHLRDANPRSPPIINPQYYKNKKDIETMLQGIQQMLRIAENTTSLGLELGAKLSQEHVPGCEAYPHRSRDYWVCNIRTLTSSIYHPAGTCRMGKVHDPTTVVDSSLRVKGVEGLRVADASNMPKITNANLNAPTIVIGEMCANMVKETWGMH